jgi:hypothetical protein
MMKRLKTMKRFNCTMILTVAVAMTAAVGVNAGDNAAPNPTLSILSTATSAELPAKAAELVSQSDAKNLKQTTVDVVKAAVGLNPAAAPAIVGSIAHATPAMAATAAATAVQLVPSQLLNIVRAAAAAAPAKAGAIVEAVCRVMPAYYQQVAEVVAQVVPGAGKDILAGISAALPELKSAINQALASYSGIIPSVTEVLMQVSQTQNTTAIAGSSSGLPGLSGGSSGNPVLLLPQGPSAVPPQVPIISLPEINPTNGAPAAPGGHNYSPP